MNSDRQYLRKAGLLVAGGGSALDLSEMHFRFSVHTADVESPNNAIIRIHNLSDDTARRVRGEYSSVVLQAGYEGAFGEIFQGSIKQVRFGKLNGVDKFLDIFAADGDIGYNFGFVNKTLAAGATSADVIDAAAKAMNVKTADLAKNHYTLPRGKVLYGMARDMVREVAATLGATWSIQNGELQLIPLRGYLPGEAVVLNKATGMIGIPEQTEQGISVRALLNPRLRIGGLFRLNNNEITQTQVNSIVAFNDHKALVQRAPMSGDGTYRLLMVEHVGDTRGQEWYSDLVGLAFDPSVAQVADGL